MLKIYGSHTPMFLKPVLAAEELGLKYEVVFIDLLKGDNRTPEHQARHPFAKVPVLEHDGEFLFESNAICRYLGDLADSPLYPKNRMARAKVEQWMDYFSLQLGRWVTSIWYQRCIAAKYFNEQPDEGQIKDWSDSILAAMPVVDEHLKNNPYMTGETFTIADVNAYMLVCNAKEGGVDLSDFRHFTRWVEGVRARPATQKVFAAWW